MSTKQDVRNFIEETFFITELQFDQDVEFADSDMFLDNGIIDSTGVLEVIAWMEETYDIKILDEELTPTHLGSVDNMVVTIERKLAEK